MLLLHDGMKLYHGSIVEVPAPDLSKCSPHKDFGRGFYLTSSTEQARAFARIVAHRKARSSLSRQLPRAVVSCYEVADVSELEILAFPTADADWLHCIVAHRRGYPFEEVIKACSVYDVLIGKVANDQTNATILAYLAGAYGELGTARADEICISLLLPERLQDQVCFRTEKSLECLRFLGSEEA